MDSNAGMHWSAVIRAHEPADINAVGVPENEDRGHAVQEIARRLDWLMFNRTCKSRQKEGGQ